VGVDAARTDDLPFAERLSVLDRASKRLRVERARKARRLRVAFGRHRGEPSRHMSTDLPFTQVSTPVPVELR